jgi:hypothetical protein
MKCQIISKEGYFYLLFFLTNYDCKYLRGKKCYNF